MTLKSDKVSRRDWFAGMAMAAIVSSDDWSPFESPEGPLSAWVAREAFALADAMIAASTNDEDEEL